MEQSDIQILIDNLDSRHPLKNNENEIYRDALVNNLLYVLKLDMRSIKISQKAMAGVMKTSNPANRSRSEAEIAAVRPMIDAARAKLGGVSMPQASGLDISAEIEAEKNRII